MWEPLETSALKQAASLLVMVVGGGGGAGCPGEISWEGRGLCLSPWLWVVGRSPSAKTQRVPAQL